MTIREQIRSQMSELIDALLQSRPLTLTVREPDRTRSLSSRNTKSSRALLHHVKLLVIINELLANGKVATKREIYYQHESLFASQQELDRALDRLARTLQAPRDNLGIVAGSKGLLFGSCVHLKGEVPTVGNDLAAETKTRIIPGQPQVVSTEGCKFVLVVEKEAAFQTIVSDYQSISECLGCQFAVITGKGYPCMATRKLVAALGAIKEIPIFILVDYDPYGMEIALQYRLGSTKLPDDADALACPTLQYIGVTFSDLDRYGHAKSLREQPLTDADRKRATGLKGKAKQTGWEALERSLGKMLDKGIKAEMEAIPNDNCFFTRSFLTEKLLSLI